MLPTNSCFAQRFQPAPASARLVEVKDVASFDKTSTTQVAIDFLDTRFAMAMSFPVENNTDWFRIMCAANVAAVHAFLVNPRSGDVGTFMAAEVEGWIVDNPTATSWTTVSGKNQVNTVAGALSVLQSAVSRGSAMHVDTVMFSSTGATQVVDIDMGSVGETNWHIVCIVELCTPKRDPVKDVLAVSRFPTTKQKPPKFKMFTTNRDQLLAPGVMTSAHKKKESGRKSEKKGRSSSAKKKSKRR